MLAERRDAAHEYYVAILNDRGVGGPVLVASAQGGMNIEEVAAKDPAAIITTPIDFENGLSKEAAIGVAKRLGFKSERAQSEAADTFINLYRIYKDKDATQIEINPMGETAEGQVLWYILLYFTISREKLSHLPRVAWTPSSDLTITPSSVRKMSSPYGISRKKNRPKSRHRRRISTSSSLTAASAA